MDSGALLRIPYIFQGFHGIAKRTRFLPPHPYPESGPDAATDEEPPERLPPSVEAAAQGAPALAADVEERSGAAPAAGRAAAAAAAAEGGAAAAAPLAGVDGPAHQAVVRGAFCIWTMYTGWTRRDDDRECCTVYMRGGWVAKVAGHMQSTVATQSR